MRRLAVVVGLCALLLPIAAWADSVNLTNQAGTVSISSSGISTIGSELLSWNSEVAGVGHSLGTVTFTTGAFVTGSIWTGGTLSPTGSTFDVTGVGLWAKALSGMSSPVALFTGSFIGPITWTVVSHTGLYNYVFTLSGEIYGMLYNGRYATGTTTQTIYAYKNQWYRDGKGVLGLGTIGLNTPEPGTLVLFGTGLIAVAGAVRRKLFGS
ncbi:MAG: PEP-CTERM sorting domain-containing protein [Terriglobales bacterium]|jgi:hypothetical protein